MSNMNDYMMWLDDRGIATWDNTIGELIVPEGTIIWTYELKDQYDNDAKWHDDPDDIELDDIEEEELIIDDGDYDPSEVCWTPQEQWFNPDGGLTGDAYTHLYAIDSKGEFV